MKSKVIFYVGVFVLLTFAAFAQNVMEIKSIDSSKLNSKVTIKGKIVNIISPSSSENFYKIYVFDSTESIRVMVPENIMRSINEKKKLEPKQDVEISGIIKTAGTVFEMHVDKASDISDGSKNAEASSDKGESAKSEQAPKVIEGKITDLSKIDKTMLKSIVTINAKVASFRKKWNDTAPNIITMTDGTNKMDVVFWLDADKEVPPEVQIAGSSLEIKGEVGEFKNKAQLKIAEAGDIKVLSAAAKEAGEGQAPASSAGSKIQIKDIDKAKAGNTVTVEGTVAEFKAAWNEKAPNKIKVSDGTGSIYVVYWKDIAEKLAQEPKQDDKIEVKGEVQVFKEELQLKALDASSLKISGEGQSAAPKSSDDDEMGKKTEKPTESAITKISDINASMKDNAVTISGEVMAVSEPRSDRAPYNVIVKDASGSVSVVYWKDLADKMSEDQAPKQGDKVEIKGTVNLFKEKIQIKIKSPSDIKKIK